MLRTSTCVRLWQGTQTSPASTQAFRLPILALSLAAIVSTGSVTQDIDSLPKAASVIHGNAKNGKRLYDSYGCYECHGGQGQGSPLSGPRIGPVSTTFSSFVKYIRQPGGQMPPYGPKITSEAELADMYVFLQSLPQPDVKNIPLLNSPSAQEKKR